MGLLPANFSVQLLGTLTVGGLLFLFGKGGNLFSLAAKVRFTIGWGPIGVGIIYGVVAIPKTGVGNATTGIIFFQLLTAYLIDHFGLLNQETVAFTWGKAFGILLMVGGAFLLLRR